MVECDRIYKECTNSNKNNVITTNMCDNSDNNDKTNDNNSKTDDTPGVPVDTGDGNNNHEGATHNNNNDKI